MGPWSFRDCVQVERRRFGLCARLYSLTNLTSLDVGVNCLLHLGPPVLSEDQFHRLCNAWMSGEDMIVTLGNDLTLKGGFSWHVDAPVIVQKPPLVRDSSFVGKGHLDPFVPKLFLSCGIFDLGVYF